MPIARREFAKILLAAPAIGAFPEGLQVSVRGPRQIVIGLGDLGARVQARIQPLLPDALFWVLNRAPTDPLHVGRASEVIIPVTGYERPERDLSHCRLSLAVRRHIMDLPESTEQAVVIASLRGLTTLVLLVPVWRYLVQRGIDTMIVAEVPKRSDAIVERRRAARTYRAAGLVEPLCGYWTTRECPMLAGQDLAEQLAIWALEGLRAEPRIHRYDPLSVRGAKLRRGLVPSPGA